MDIPVVNVDRKLFARIADRNLLTHIADHKPLARIADRKPFARLADRKVFARVADLKLFARVADGELFSRIANHRLFTRINLHAAGAAAGFALLVGLSVPVSSLSDANPASATVESANGGSPTVAAAAVEAVTGAVAPPAPAPAPVVAPTGEQMHPLGVSAGQEYFVPSAEQMSNAKAIVDAGKAMGLPPRAWVIAVATSLQESNLKNLGYLGDRNDHDSQGLFQQRPSSGWGTVAQITDPNYAASAFYKALVQVNGWESMPLTSAAQKVQVSAYPDHYAKHEIQAGNIVAALHGAGPFAGIAAS
jgi:hypothetical protein